MINDLKEIRRNREKEKDQLSNASTQDTKPSSSSKTQILNKLDQEIIQNYKFKILHMESENARLREDLLAMQRNFEALCLKGKSDSEFVKKLEEEIAFLKSKSTNHEKDFSKYEKEKNDIVNNYHEKIDQLNKVIKNLEEKLNNNGNNNIKFLEKESSYKMLIAKLENQVKTYENDNRKLREENKKFREEYKKIKDEKNSLENELAEKVNLCSGMENKIKTEQQSVLENNDKLSKENNLLMKLLEETRKKLEEAKSQSTDKDREINSLRERLQSNISKLSELENNNQNFLGDSMQKVKIMEDLKQKVYNLEKENSEILSKIKDKDSKWLEVTKKNDDLLIKNSDFLAENSKLKSEVDRLKSELSEMINNDKKQLVDELTAQNHKLITTNSIFNSEVDLLKKENKNLKNELDAKGRQENSDKMNEEKTRILLFKVLKENVLNIENTNKKLMENNFDPIERKIILMQHKIRNLSEVVYEKINGLKNYSNKNTQNLSEEIKQREKALNEQIHRLRSENKELINKNNELKAKNEELDNFNKRFKNELDTYKLLLQEESQKQTTIKAKLERKRKKLKTLREQQKNFENQKENFDKKTKELEANMAEYEKKLEESKNNNELKSCIQQIMSSNFKLALSLDSLYYMSLCRGCSEERNPQFIRSCGHTTCEECLKGKRECVECKEVNSLPSKIENCAFSNMVSKILFINQVKNDINGIIDFIKMKLS